MDKEKCQPRILHPGKTAFQKEILKRKEILTHATTWMNLEDIMVSEINQSQRTNTVCFHLDEVLRDRIHNDDY
jgi:hypothetical protein